MQRIICQPWTEKKLGEKKNQIKFATKQFV